MISYTIGIYLSLLIVYDIMKQEVKVWFDKQADRLEVIYEAKKGYWKDTNNDAVMVKVDMEENILGFSVDAVTQTLGPLHVTLGGNTVKVSSLSPEQRRIFEESMKRNEGLMKKLSKM